MKMQHGLRIATLLFFGGSSLMSASAHAEWASSETLLNRCYMHFTQGRLPANSPLRNLIKNGGNAIDACLKILDAVRISNGNIVSNRTDLVSNEEALRVGREMNKVHASWFKNNRIEEALPVYQKAGGRETHDSEIGATYMTELVLSDRPFRELVTGNRSIARKSTKNTGEADMQVRWTGQRLTIFSNSWDRNGGYLTGYRYITNPPSVTFSDRYWGREEPFETAPNKIEGGGVLGHPAYIMLNAGFRQDRGMNRENREAYSDGGVRLFRRYSEAIAKDFFCRNLPVLRQEDAVGMVQQYKTGRPTFRVGSSCVRCHAYMDPLAGVLRAYTVAGEITGRQKDETFPWIQKLVTPAMPSVLGPANVNSRDPASLQRLANAMPDSDQDYYRRPPEGVLYYRSFTGELKYHGPAEISNLEGLGKVIANSDDYYACAASRYFRYFTGNNIPLVDYGNPAERPAMNDDQARMFSWFKDTLVSNFKRHQSVRQLIGEILNSDYYRSLNFQGK